MYAWKYLLVLNICLIGCSAYALVEQAVSPSSEVLDQKEFQRATAEASDVAYARVLEEQKALQAEAETRVQGQHRMTFQEIRAGVSASGDMAEDGVSAERVSANSADPLALTASEKRVRLLHGLMYTIFGVLAGWTVYWGWQKVTSASS